ncbi:TatD family deoxyribonuclease [Candidatus Parcubacteria bacterium]|jgi:TatD DNase family protein|nr:MAG: TatD family deoxyribonuclease [Candidatus Parcubacteria bacterium]
MLIDTHAHLNFNAYKDDLEPVIKRTLAESMKVINVGSQFSTSLRAVKIAQAYPGQMFAAIGLHPIHLHETFVDEVEIPFKSRAEDFAAAKYEALAKEKGVVAIGECGLDYFHLPASVSELDFIKKQKEVFEEHITLAKKLNLPIILHCRSTRAEPDRAYLEMLEILKHENFNRGVVHCFSASLGVAKKFLEAGFFISFTGIITFPNTKSLAEVVKSVPLDKLMVETDAPYLAPQAVRGQRNEPINVKYVAERIAIIKDLSYEEVERQTTENAVKLFKLTI